MAEQQQWSSNIKFLMAAVGAAVGLANVWRFPYIAGTNGGGAFVLLYILCALSIVVPILIAEIMIGRRGKTGFIGSMLVLSRESGLDSRWRFVGWMGTTALLLILSLYFVVAGWTLDYIVSAASGTFQGLEREGSEALFDGLMSSPWRMILWQTLFIISTAVIASVGLKRGVEKAIGALMPLLLVSLLVLLVYGMFAGDFGKSLRFMFELNFSAITGEVVMVAAGQAFFSIGIGLGVMLTYGSYLPKEAPIPYNASVIVFADTLVAIIAGLAVFSIVFAFGLAPDSGPNLIYVTLPIAFGQMPLGSLFGTIFFVLLFSAAITTTIGGYEVLAKWLYDYKGIDRKRSTVFISIAIWLLGLLTVFSFNIWSDIKPFAFIDYFADKNIFGLIDYFAANILLPLTGVLISIFVGWRIKENIRVNEMAIGEGPAYQLWRWSLKYIAPIAVTSIFLYQIIQGNSH